MATNNFLLVVACRLAYGIDPCSPHPSHHVRLSVRYRRETQGPRRLIYFVRVNAHATATSRTSCAVLGHNEQSSTIGMSASVETLRNGDIVQWSSGKVGFRVSSRGGERATLGTGDVWKVRALSVSKCRPRENAYSRKLPCLFLSLY